MERRLRLDSVVGHEADIRATCQGQGRNFMNFGSDCDWSILQAVAAGNIHAIPTLTLTYLAKADFTAMTSCYL